MVPMHLILDDPHFKNQRLDMDKEKLAELTTSMMHEGLKMPIVVIEMSGDTPYFHVRAGFRRIAAARQLGWKHIACIVLPDTTPASDEYWTNIIENSARTDLSTYELACAIRTMRDKFKVTSVEFAARTGYSISHIENLLRCLNQLPDEVLEQWKGPSRIPYCMFLKWTSLSPSEAISNMHRYAHQHPEVPLGWSSPHPATESIPARPKIHGSRLTTASVSGLKRMQQARVAFAVNTNLDRKTQILALHIIDFCSGGRDDIPGHFTPKKKAKTDRVAELKLPDMPDVDSNSDLPLPSEDDEDDEEC